jgi:hypothetical protein
MTRSFAVSSFGFQYYRHVTSAANTVHGCPCCTCCGYTTRNTLYTTRNTLSFNAVDKYRQLNTFHGTVLYPHMYNTHTVGVHPPHQNTRLPPPLPEHQSIHNVSKRDLLMNKRDLIMSKRLVCPPPLAEYQSIQAEDTH